MNDNTGCSSESENVSLNHLITQVGSGLRRSVVQPHAQRGSGVSRGCSGLGQSLKPSKTAEKKMRICSRRNARFSRQGVRSPGTRAGCGPAG